VILQLQRACVYRRCYVAILQQTVCHSVSPNAIQQVTKSLTMHVVCPYPSLQGVGLAEGRKGKLPTLLFSLVLLLLYDSDLFQQCSCRTFSV
jgi:hypothetical protein